MYILTNEFTYTAIKNNLKSDFKIILILTNVPVLINVRAGPGI